MFTLAKGLIEAVGASWEILTCGHQGAESVFYLLDELKISESSGDECVLVAVRHQYEFACVDQS